MITISGLSKSYGSVLILNNISYTFNTGKIYGIIGKNGAGKTTLFNCMTGLESYTGSITFKNNTKKNLGYLATEPFFFPKLTGREYIRLLVQARNIKNFTIEDNNIFELPLDRYVDQYSTGMKKKLALTAILGQGNSCYILDEPFNGVDLQSNMIIEELLFKLKSLNKTILISSHILSTLTNFCDELLLLENGIFSKKVTPENFVQFEADIKMETIKKNLDRMKL
ncbi:ATP-binding cassette domain-containing protein [Aquimarina sp. ERC-38]|uniref:ABC transporter ATP-binding protein n=1 Tax=Aquimarina sp. ERC-38 TaxID=2949996 RepID=UPI00224860E2|nr:ATP-binding cassette domain-containing protein [Aquimarina sp. ERC-38]UZO79998.1 ATP-binding cassette domain-containing protein [Aquimarina sp. ERC-38]